MNVIHRVVLVTLSVFAIGLAGCGDGDDGQPASGSTRTQNTAPSSAAPSNKPSPNASAAEVAKEARGKVSCPAKIQTAARAPDAPVDDVVGVRPGLTYDEAANLILCSDELMVVALNNRRHFNIQTYSQEVRQGMSGRTAKERVQKTSQQIMQEMQNNAMARANNAVVRDLQPGEAKWHVGTMGLPGQERVIQVAREEWFAADRKPPLASVQQALLDKYGTPTGTNERGRGHAITWAYDPFGRLITETSPLFGRCTGNPDPDAGVNLSPDCGIVVTAAVYPPRDNPELAEYMQVSVVDQANGYELITTTEQELQRMENDRRAKEVEDAAQNADKPML